MKKIVALLLISFVLTSFTTRQGTKQGKLIILIAIDGLNGDLLERYRPAFSHGFKRMFAEGLNCKNAFDNHAITVSLPGHVTLATGNYPSTHGIVDGAFYEKSGDTVKAADSYEDPNYTIVGQPGRMSVTPKKVLTPGLAEWVRKANPASKVLCVGTGEISSALYCFHANEPVYWYDERSGRYVTSTYYSKTDPAWVTKFNNGTMPGFLKMSKRWDNIVPPKFLGLADRDDDKYERQGKPHTFPYIAPDSIEKKNLYRRWIPFTPFLDSATLELAKQGIASLKIGQSRSVDYLSIVLSCIDDTNHEFGPSSLETFNVLLHMDAALGDFYAYLDKTVGKGNYAVALSADHGFPELPEHTLRKGRSARRLSAKVIDTVMNAVKAIENNSKGLTARQMQERIKSYLKKQDFVADAYTADQLNNKAVSKDKYLELFKKSHTKDRVGEIPFLSPTNWDSEVANAGLMVRLKENYIADLDCDVHGSAYNYDRHVPLLFMGMHIKHGVLNKTVFTVDVAPSLAKLGNIAVGNRTDGKSIF